MTVASTGALIEQARAASGLSQRALADKTGISQSTLSRIVSGDRPAKMPEVLVIAWATGCTVAELTGSVVAGRVQYAARATNDADMEAMRRELLHYLELSAYLDEQGIPSVP